MALLISPKLIPLIDYSTTDEYDKNDHWVPDLSQPMTIKNVWGDALIVEGLRLKRRLSKVATIYRNADEKISAVPRKLLTVSAVVKGGCLRGTVPDRSQSGLLFQMNEDVLTAWGLTNLMPNAVIASDAVYLATPNCEVTAYEREYTYDNLVEREFSIDD